jgi:hypothetical protein
LVVIYATDKRPWNYRKKENVNRNQKRKALLAGGGD